MRRDVRAPISSLVKFRNLLPMLAVLALLLTPLRMWGGEAMAMPHHPATAAASEAPCHGSSEAPASQPEQAQVDCMLACAAVTPPAHPEIAPVRVAIASYTPSIPFSHSGVRPEFEPPPPRMS